MDNQNEILFNRFLKNSPELTTYFNKEKELLGEKELTEYLFFAYVVEEGLKDALKTNNVSLLKRLFEDIEFFVEDEIKSRIDIVYTSLFEDLCKEFKSKVFNKYMQKKTKKLWKKYSAII